MNPHPVIEFFRKRLVKSLDIPIDIIYGSISPRDNSNILKNQKTIILHKKPLK